MLWLVNLQVSDYSQLSDYTVHLQFRVRLLLRQLRQFNNELIPDFDSLTGKTSACETVGFVILILTLRLF